MTNILSWMGPDRDLEKYSERVLFYFSDSKCPKNKKRKIGVPKSGPNFDDFTTVYVDEIEDL
jgi:hypothetical protein